MGIAAILMAVEVLFTGLHTSCRQADQDCQGRQASGTDQA